MKADAESDPNPSPFERFEDALRRVLSVPKATVDKRIKERKKDRQGREKKRG